MIHWYLNTFIFMCVLLLLIFWPLEYYKYGIKMLLSISERCLFFHIYVTAFQVRLRSHFIFRKIKAQEKIIYNSKLLYKTRKRWENGYYTGIYIAVITNLFLSPALECQPHLQRKLLFISDDISPIFSKCLSSRREKITKH